MNPFESTAYAAGAGGGFPIDILLLVGFVLIFYFLLCLGLLCYFM